MNGPLDGHHVVRGGFVRLPEGKPVLAGVLEDGQDGQESRVVSRSLTRQPFVKVPKIIKVVYLLSADRPSNVALAAVVGGQDRGPIAEDMMQFFEIGDGRRRGLRRVKPFVDPVVSFQSEFIARGRNELPETKSA